MADERDQKRRSLPLRLRLSLPTSGVLCLSNYYVSFLRRPTSLSEAGPGLTLITLNLPHIQASVVMPSLLLISLGLFVLYYLQRIFIRPLFSPLRHLPGPERRSWWSGDLQDIFDAEPGAAHRAWVAEARAKGLGAGAVKYGGLFGDTRLFFTDPAALNHVLLTKSYQYPKPNEVRGNLSRILGKGILFAEGDDHRRQRRIMNPAFSISHVRALVPTFFEQSYKLRDKWQETITAGTFDEQLFKDVESANAYQKEKKEKKDGEVVMDVSPWFSRLTLDIIGLTGFGYNFNALDDRSNKLAAAFAGMMPTGNKKMNARGLLIQRAIGYLVTYIPWMKYLPNERLTMVRKGFEVMEEESMKIVLEKKEEVKKAGNEGLEGKKDLITLLLKSNMTEAKNQMSDSELQGQMTTFILAGHETTSTALTWTMFLLSRYPEAQAKLRKEVRAGTLKAQAEGRDEMSADELNGLEYLDAVVREVLRLEPPVSSTIRIASEDDIIPLSTPMTLSNGSSVSSIHVPAKTVVFLNVNAVNLDPTVFGEDATSFRPERWLEGKQFGGEKGPAVGIWSHLLTFLAGPRACIGYRFSLLELKAILTVIISEFAFEERNAGIEVERRSAIVTRPLLKGEDRVGRMPLRVTIAPKDS